MTTRFIIGLLVLLTSCSNKSNTESIASKQIVKKKEKEITVDTTDFGKRIKIDDSIRFENYKVEVYSGKLAQPNFENNEFKNDPEYVNFIKKGCEKKNINFGGYYTIITKSCGANCVLLFIVNRKTGSIYTDINIKEGLAGFEYRKDSELLIGNANLFIDGKFEYYYKYYYAPEFYKWNGSEFKKLE
jgi:hypothetical protein